MAYYSPEMYLGEDDLNEDKNNLEGKVEILEKRNLVEESNNPQLLQDCQASKGFSCSRFALVIMG